MPHSNNSDVFQLQSELPEGKVQEAICHRLAQLHALAKMLEAQECHEWSPGMVQGYSWVMVRVVEEMQALFFALWERE